MTTRGLFSIGHSNHPLEKFLDLLRQHRIEVLVDCRSQPYSRFSPHFNTRSLKETLTGAGIEYLFLGKELGGRPEGEEFYDEEGHVLYARLAKAPLFLEGIERLENGIAAYRVALMCSEEDPSACHRHLLVGRVLATRGIQMEHIRGDGRVQTEAELRSDEGRTGKSRQTELFEEPVQETGWRSVQSVLQRRRRSSPRR